MYIHPEYVKFCLLHPLVGHIISVLEVRVRIRVSLYDQLFMMDSCQVWSIRSDKGHRYVGTLFFDGELCFFIVLPQAVIILLYYLLFWG